MCLRSSTTRDDWDRINEQFTGGLVDQMRSNLARIMGSADWKVSGRAEVGVGRITPKAAAHARLGAER